MATHQAVSALPSLVKNQPNDIAALFNQLQVSVDQAQKQTRSSDNTAITATLHLQRKHRTESDSFSSTSSSATSASPVTPHPPVVSCPCHHWLVSIDSEHCAMCDAPVDILIEWQTERIENAKSLRSHKRQLLDMTSIQDQQQNDMMHLQRKILEHRETLMTREDDMLSLQQDMEKLQTKYNDESAQIETIELAKQAARREIEELGQHLFKEAQDMVAREQQEKSVVQSSCDSLKTQLEQAQRELDQVAIELQILRKDMGRRGDQQDEQLLLSLNNYGDTSNEASTNDSGNTSSNRSSTTTRTTISSGSLSSSSSMATPVTIATDELPSSTPTIPPAIPTTSQQFLLRAKVDLATLQDGLLDDHLQLETFEDDQQLADFKEFMDSATSTSFSLRKLHGLPFIKLCLADDIEPCLRFGPNPKVTNSRRILEAIQIKTCFVEKCPPGFVREQAALLRRDRLVKKNKPSLWDKFATSSSTSLLSSSSSSSSSASSSSASSPFLDNLTPVTSSSSTTTRSSLSLLSATTAVSSSSTVIDHHYISCATCGRRVKDNEDDASMMEKELGYRFRISYFDEWSCIDRYCADRLNAVIAFYTFLRKLRLGSYNNRSLMDVYQECSRLRLSMFLCRLGALPPSA